MRVVFFILLIFSLFGCSKNSKEKAVDNPTHLAKKFLHINENENFVSLHPYEAIDGISVRIISQIYEGLVRFNAKGDSIVPCLAKSYKISSDSLQYTFRLKQAYFHPNKCFRNKNARSVSAEDIEYCFKKLFIRNKENLVQYKLIDNIVGAKNYRNTQRIAKDSIPIPGIKVIDHKTIQFSLVNKDPYFLDKLASPLGYIYPREAILFYRRMVRLNPVGTGPFMIRSEQDIQEDIAITMVKNPDYHINNQPLLDGIHISFIKDKNTELKNFEDNKLDVIHHISRETWTKIHETNKIQYDDYKTDSILESNSVFLGFNLNKTPFNKLDLRKSLSYSIHQNNIDSTYTGNYPFNADSSKKYLKLAGYLNPKEFPSSILTFSSEYQFNSSIAKQISKDIKKTLNIGLELNTIPLTFHERGVRNKKYKIFIYNYLNCTRDKFEILKTFQTSSKYPNITGFSNADFDKYVSSNKEIANSIVKTQIPIIRISDIINYYCSQYKVKNLVWSTLPYLDLREVYFESPKVIYPVN